MVTYLLDTSTWIELLRGNEAVVQRMQRCSPRAIRLSPIVQGELETGRQLSQSAEQAEMLEWVYHSFPRNAFGDAVARQCGVVRAQLRRAGTPIGVNDTWIAAEALAHGQTVVTANERDFRRVPGLSVENWMV
ncbi:MAG: type II toxin-antitoxin system VapC family toxin [Propionibacteriaceae bacterium]|nr:type II toxin-antitoxin system VapC family toxin [Propionibacteriaceae bacterium]